MRSHAGAAILIEHPIVWDWDELKISVLKKTPPAATANEVWVNTRSGKYWKPGSRFYGKTKEGEFMPELEALDRGYSPAGGTGE
jgi:hypothetical protein